jgi:hypothetical protein
MQEEVDAYMRALVHPPAPSLDDEEADFGLRYPFEVVRLCWWAWREHGVLPEAGGLLDQDWWLMNDIFTLNARYNLWEARRERQ